MPKKAMKKPKKKGKLIAGVANPRTKAQKQARAVLGELNALRAKIPAAGFGGIADTQLESALRKSLRGEGFPEDDGSR